jgi:hypothetical protein
LTDELLQARKESESIYQLNKKKKNEKKELALQYQ